MDSFVSAQSRIQTVPSETQVTPVSRNGEFGRVLANAALAQAENAVSVIPGAPIMTLALRSATGSSSFVPSAGTSIGALPGGAGSTAAATGPGANTGSGGTDPLGGSASGMDASLQSSHDANMYFLQIQEKVNAENRSFTTLSNVLKAEHETVKTAISNIR